MNFLARMRAVGRSRSAHAVFAILVPTVCLFTMELLHRGTLWKNFLENTFWKNFPSFGLTWLLLLAVYGLVLSLTRLPWLATFIVGAASNASGIVCYYKLQMRGEPFLPWDFSQIGDLMGVADKVSFKIKPFMLVALCAFLVLILIAVWIGRPPKQKDSWEWRLFVMLASLSLGTGLVFGVFLQPEATKWFGIYSDMWMQDRYYRNYGVVTGFLTNLTVLDIAEPEPYSKETVGAVLDETALKAADAKPLYENSYAATAEKPVEKPNIIFVMNESFWDVTRLNGITFDREITPNLTALKQEGASGYVYTPSFGGGTCDVEFEVLTGFSVSHLPAGSKPYQQYVTKDMFSLPQFLKQEGYETLAIHGYYAKFWSRNLAYPNLGIDTFIAAEDFVNPQKKRGFISDEAMTKRIIEEYEARSTDGPVFIHAVTMQNHTTYNENRYPAGELVNITDYPTGVSRETISQLRDFATGISEADAALGELVEYFRAQEEPTIIVFWGDHFNPVGKEYELYEKTGFIEKGEMTSPNLRETDLLIWSNYDANASAIDLGTVSSYNVTPVMMDLYGLRKPLYFTWLTQQLSVLRGRTHGTTVQPDSTTSSDMTEAQQAVFDTQWLLQYDFLFGEPYQKDYVPYAAKQEK